MVASIPGEKEREGRSACRGMMQTYVVLEVVEVFSRMGAAIGRPVVTNHVTRKMEANLFKQEEGVDTAK